jgi:YggT family protein
VTRLAATLIVALSFVVMARVVASWVDPYRRQPTSRWLTVVTEPFVGPIRRRLPPTGPLDLSPMLLVGVLALILGALRA